MTVWAQLAFVALGVMLIETANIALGGQRPVVLLAWDFLKRRAWWWLGPILLMLALFVFILMRPEWFSRLAL